MAMPASGQPMLKRSLSLPLMILYGLGTTIGAGIYVLIGKVAGRAGLYAPVSFLAASLIAGVTALAFAELCSRHPRSAGEALYVREGLRSERLSTVVGLLVVAAGTVSAAAICIGAAGYVQAILDAPPWLLVGAIVAALAFLAAWGISESVGAVGLLTLVEIGGLLLVVWAGSSATPETSPAPGDLLPPFSGAAWGGIFAGAILAFFAFIGFEDMVNVAEEVKDAPRALPLAIVLTLAVTAALYVAVALVAVLAVPVDELAASDAPLALIYARGGGAPTTIVVIGIFATLNGALIQIIMASRVLYGMGSQGWLPAALGRVNARTRTPLIATGLVACAVLVFAFALPIESLAEASSLITLTIFALVNLALVRIKRREPRPAGAVIFPAWVPLAGFITGAALVVLELLRLSGMVIS